MKGGTRHRATRLAEKLMADDAEAVVNAVVTAAKGGDMTATRLVLDRFGAADAVQALPVVADAMAGGVLSAEKAQAAGVTDGDGR
jgi:glutamate formiminotransferase